jgi:hypothetical protein
MPAKREKPSTLYDLKALILYMVPKAEGHGPTNAAIDRMSKAAGLDKFVGNKFGHVKHAGGCRPGTTYRRYKCRGRQDAGNDRPASTCTAEYRVDEKKPSTLYDLKALILYMVPKAGLEPARLAPLPPQDSVSTNFTTSAMNRLFRCGNI